MPDTANGTGLFGSGQPLFGVSSESAAREPPDLLSLSIQPTASTSYGPPLPAYQPPQYLTTIDEYLPPPEEMDIDDADDEDKLDLRNERWEQLLPKYMDEVFERFAKRLKDAEGGSSQVLRSVLAIFANCAFS